jgi:hypothetical protein
MRDARQGELWVVYVNSGGRQAGGLHVICRQYEWDQMERERPGRHTLVQSGIASENEAETIARAGLVAVERTKAAEQKRRREQRAQIARDAR